jgi:hypothetical protein
MHKATARQVSGNISSERRARSSELREDGRWEIEDGDKKIWFTKFKQRAG